jgi:outer membrane protein assembly factor BamB
VPRLAPVWTKELDGRIYASPLAFTVGGRRLLFVSTEAGSVYALIAGDGSIVWQHNVGTVKTEACGTWGITATGAISRSGRVLYVIGATGLLHALSLESGDDAAGYPRQLITHPDYEYVWGGLRIAAGRLYVPVASYCDVDPDTGAVYTAVGNSHVWSDECACYVDGAGCCNHVVALTPDLTAVLDAQSPGIESTGDYDFGAAPMLFQPNGCPPLAAANNKNGTLYIWDRTRLSSGPIAAIPVGDGGSSRRPVAPSR